MDRLSALQIHFDLSPAMAKILILLLDHPVVTPRMIEGQHSITKDAKVAMHRLRRRLECMDPVIEVKSRRDVGYWLDPDDRDQVEAGIRKRMGQAPEAAPAGTGPTV